MVKQYLQHYVSFPGSSLVKNLPAKQEMQVWSLGQEDPLEKEMATHSSILAWEIPWTEEPGVTKSQTQLGKWTTTTTASCMELSINPNEIGPPLNYSLLPEHRGLNRASLVLILWRREVGFWLSVDVKLKSCGFWIPWTAPQFQLSLKRHSMNSPQQFGKSCCSLNHVSKAVLVQKRIKAEFLCDSSWASQFQLNPHV